jgi:hypothetical protein
MRNEWYKVGSIFKNGLVGIRDRKNDTTITLVDSITYNILKIYFHFNVSVCNNNKTFFKDREGVREI